MKRPVDQQPYEIIFLSLSVAQFKREQVVLTGLHDSCVNEQLEGVPNKVAIECIFSSACSH